MTRGTPRTQAQAEAHNPVTAHGVNWGAMKIKALWLPASTLRHQP
jgi:hypothetical protein